MSPERVLNGRPSSPSTVPKLTCCELDVVVAPQPRRGEKLLEVQALAMIDDVQNRVRPPGLHAIADRGQVGRAVEERAVLLADDASARLLARRRRRTPRRRSPGRCRDLGQIVDHGGQPVLVKTLAQRVVERHVEPPVHPLDLVLAGRQKLVPQPPVLGIAGVQLGGLGQHGAADVGMLVQKVHRRRIALDVGQSSLDATS